MGQLNLFGKICVNCTIAAIVILGLISAAVLIWTMML